MKKMIWFDMDGTIADFYGVNGWLDYLLNEDATPYREAKPLLNMSLLARYLNKLQRMGYGVGVISWGSKHSTDEFLNEVTAAKLAWLNKHLKSVKWDVVHVVHYGTNKFNTCGGGVLFDDELNNRVTWGEDAYEPSEILNILKALVA